MTKHRILVLLMLSFLVGGCSKLIGRNVPSEIPSNTKNNEGIYREKAEGLTYFLSKTTFSVIPEEVGKDKEKKIIYSIKANFEADSSQRYEVGMTPGWFTNDRFKLDQHPDGRLQHFGAKTHDETDQIIKGLGDLGKSAAKSMAFGSPTPQPQSAIPEMNLMQIMETMKKESKLCKDTLNIFSEKEKKISDELERTKEALKQCTDTMIKATLEHDKFSEELSKVYDHRNVLSQCFDDGLNSHKPPLATTIITIYKKMLSNELQTQHIKKFMKNQDTFALLKFRGTSDNILNKFLDKLRELDTVKEALSKLKKPDAKKLLQNSIQDKIKGLHERTNHAHLKVTCSSNIDLKINQTPNATSKGQYKLKAAILILEKIHRELAGLEMPPTKPDQRISRYFSNLKKVLKKTHTDYVICQQPLQNPECKNTTNYKIDFDNAQEKYMGAIERLLEAMDKLSYYKNLIDRKMVLRKFLQRDIPSPSSKPKKRSLAFKTYREELEKVDTVIKSLLPKGPSETPPTGPNDKDKLLQVPTFYLDGKDFKENIHLGDLIDAWIEYGNLDSLMDIHQKKAAALYFEK